jgi:ATP-dependent exoDNAse (exonuclease V) alpha subunit
MQEHDCLHLVSGKQAAQEALIAAWSTHKAALHDKTIIAATRADVASLNQLARGALIASGQVLDSQGIDVAITLKDESQERRRLAPGDRIVFTKNDRDHDTTNGLLGTIKSIEHRPEGPHLVVELDDASKSGLRQISVPASFGYLDLAYCLTNHKAQGKTVDTAFVFVDPRYSGREWSYVAASRSKHGTHLFVDEAPLHPVNPDAHHEHEAPTQSPLELLAARMSRSQAKGTSLDYEPPDTSRSQGILDRLSHALEGVVDQAKKFAARKAHAEHQAAQELQR